MYSVSWSMVAKLYLSRLLILGRQSLAAQRGKALVLESQPTRRATGLGHRRRIYVDYAQMHSPDEVCPVRALAYDLDAISTRSVWIPTLGICRISKRVRSLAGAMKQ